MPHLVLEWSHSINSSAENSEIIVEGSEELTRLLSAEEEPLSFWEKLRFFVHLFIKISKFSLEMGLSYTFSLQLIAVSIFFSYLDPQDEDNYLAAATIITASMNLAFLALSSELAISTLCNNRFGKLQRAEKDGDMLTSEEMRVQIAAIYDAGMLSAPVLLLPVAGYFIFSKPLLINLFHQNETVAELVQKYLRISVFYLAALGPRICAEQIMFMMRHSASAMRIGLINFAIGTGLAAWLGFGGLGVQALGELGPAIGYTIEACSTTFLYTRHIVFNDSFKDFHFFQFAKNLKGNLQSFIEFFKLGSTICLSMVTELGVPFVTSLLAGTLGEEEQAAWNFAMLLMFVSIVFSLCFGQGNSQELSRIRGNKKYEEARNVALCGLVITLTWVMPLPLLLAIHPNLLTFMAGEEKEEITTLLSNCMGFVSAGVIADTIRNYFLQQLRALDNKGLPTIISTVSLTAGMLTAIILALKTELGLPGIAMGYALGPSLAAGLLSLSWLMDIQPARMQRKAEDLSNPKRYSCFGLFKEGKDSQNHLPQPAC